MRQTAHAHRQLTEKIDNLAILKNREKRIAHVAGNFSPVDDDSDSLGKRMSSGKVAFQGV